MSGVQAEELSVQGGHSCEEPTWQTIDRELRNIAAQRGQLDGNEAFWLCWASRQEIWRNVGRASFLEYLEEVLGYTPKCARERVRVACALDTVPELAEALATGEQSYSAIRELTRVATPDTQTAWREAARGKNVRAIEELVSVHAPGDRPSDPPRPDLKPRRLSFEVSTATFARLRQVQQILAEEHGAQLDDDALIETLCAAILDGGTGQADQGRARHQVMTTICDACLQGWQQGGGRQIAVATTDIEMVECDAQWIGSDREPSRAKQDITPKVRRHVWHRDHGNCKVTGCRSSRHIDVHHIVPRHLGGGHEAENLTLLCSGHHRSLHNGALHITGRAPDLTMTWTNLSAGIEHELSPMSHVGHTTERHASTLPALHVGRAPAIETKSPLPAPMSHVGHTTARHVAMHSEPDNPASPSPSSAAQVAPALANKSPLPSSSTGRSSKYERAVMKIEAIQALSTAGFHKSIARTLVDGALATAPEDVTLEALLVTALQRSRTG